MKEECSGHPGLIANGWTPQLVEHLTKRLRGLQAEICCIFALLQYIYITNLFSLYELTNFYT
jgi:hypothetical protein